MNITFTNSSKNIYTIKNNSNNLVILHNNTPLSVMQSSSVNNISTLISEYESLENEKKIIKTNLYGQIKYIDLEGGFYGIITDSKEHYLPINLQDKLKNYENHYIEITLAYTKKDEANIYMWGKLLYVETYGIIVID